MYSDKLVTAVKHNGRVLRENGDTVKIPFGCEYSLLIKNKNSVRALVRVEIDGVDATEGTRLIVPANGSLDLERFIKEGNFNQGNRFKFIERTKKIEDGPRGIQAEDGLIRVEFEFEQEPAPIKPDHGWNTRPWNNPQWIRDQLLRDSIVGQPLIVKGPTWGTGAPVQQLYNATCASSSLAGGGTITCNASYSAKDADVTFGSLSASTHDSAEVKADLNDIGITVPGSVSDQKFVQGSWFPTDGVKHVMVLRLLGEVEGKPVEKPVTVKAKPKCVTCGTVNKANVKFCRECGTALTIV